MATSTFTTQSVFADARGARWRWVIAALLAIVAIVGGQILGVSPVAAAGGFSVSVAEDGTGQGTAAGCTITGPGGDNTPTDGVVCTNDTVRYRWAYDIPSNETVTVTMTQTLPVGLTWQANNTTVCEAGPNFTGTGVITDGGRTLTCVVTFQPTVASRSGFFDMFALVGPTVPDGFVVNSDFVYDQGAGATTDPAEPVTVRSDVRVNLIKASMVGVDVSPTQTRVLVNVAGVQDGFANAKGVAAIDTPFTFVDDLAGMPANTTLEVNNGDCRRAPTGGSPTTSSLPGTWFCTQAGPGQPITITVTGADTSGRGSSTDLNGKTIFAGAFRLLIPAASIPPGGVVAENQLRGFAPSAGGAQNYDGNWEPGGAPADTCTSPDPNDNCAEVPLQPYAPTGTYQILKSIDVVPAVTSLNGDAAVAPGQTFETKIPVINTDPSSNPENLLVCEKFEPTKQQVNGAPSIVTAGTTPPYIFEYSTQPIVGGQVSTATCGFPGDTTTDGPWYPSVAAAGGPANVSSVRVVFTGTMPQVTFDFKIPMINVSSTPLDRAIDYVGSSHTTKPFSNDRSASYTVTSNVLSVTKRSNGQVAGDAVRNEVVPFTISPVFSQPGGGSDPQVLTVVDPLDSCYLSPTIAPATLLSWDVVITPADPGPDGIICSPDDVSGPILTFTSLSPLTPNVAVPAIDYSVTISPASLDNSLHFNTATVSAPGNAQDDAARRDTQNMSVRGSGLVDITKFVDAPQVQIQDQIGFSAQWSNTLASDAGLTRWIDILPYNGDGRGTSFSGSLSLLSLNLLGTPTNDVTIEYTSRTPGAIDGDPNAPSNQPAGATTWCVAGDFGTGSCPANIGATTAIRITIGNLSAGRQGGVHFTMQPTGNVEGDVYQNVVSLGRTANFPQPIPQSNQVRVDVVASSVGDTVWWDLDRNGTQEPGEPGIGGVTVTLLDGLGNVLATTTTDSNGLYTFPGLRSGDYRVAIDQSTLPYSASIVPTYDLDGGTTSPNGDSGNFPLGVNQDRTDVDFGYDLPDTVDGTPYIQTTISSQAAAPGATVTDLVQFTDVTAGTYTWTIYGPVAPVTPGTCVGIDWTTALAHESGSLLVPAGTSSATTPVVALDAGVGCYTYSGSFLIDGLGGVTLTHPRGLAAETVLVSANTPNVATVAQNSTNRPGATVSDDVTITGLSENTTYTWSLLGPLAPVGGSCDAVDWTGAPPVVATDTFAVTPGTTDYNTGNRTVTAVGCYTYSGSLAATPTSNAVTLLPGIPIESFQISANAPDITTTASQNNAGPTDTVFDNFTISDLGSQSATYSWTLLGPVPAIGGSCTTVNWVGAPVFDSGSQIVPGDGTYQTSSTVLGNAGCYSYTGALAATATSDAVALPAGEPAETVLVSAVTPTVSTQASSNTAAAGSSVTDTVLVNGLVGPTTYDWALLGPVAPIGGVCDTVNWAGAATVGSGTIAIPANGSHLTPAVTLPASGCFTYIGTLAATGASNAVILPAGVPEETVLANSTTPGISTQASTNSTGPLTSVSDSVTVSGLGTQNVTYTWVLYGPVTPVTTGTCVGIDWSTAPVFDTGTEAITGDGTFSTDSSVLGNAGCYTYTGSLPATATTNAFTTARGIPAETIMVNANTPGIATQASINATTPQTSVTDSVVITGLGTEASTYTWSLLGPLPEVAGACDAVDWTPALATPYDTGSFPVNGNGTYQTPATVLAAVGCYTYIGTVAATGTTNAASQAPGDPLETVRVTANQPQVVTQASTNTASPGVSLNDSVIVSGLTGETATYTWTLLGPAAPVTAGTCVGIDWSTAAIFDSGSLVVTGNGTYTTASTTLNAAGCYSYTGNLAGTATSTPVVLAAGVPAETALIAANTPTATTQASVNVAAPGTVVTDSVVISGLGAQASTYAWTLVGPMAPVTPGTCAGIDWSTGLVFTSGSFAVAGDGTYTTPPSTLTLPGCYSYTSDLAATASSARFIQAAGVPAETVRVDANAAAVATTISDQTTTSGDTVTDSVTVSGLANETTDYHWTLVGPVPPATATTCPPAGPAWTGAATVQAGDVTGVGNGTFSTPAVTVLAAGCYSYTGVLDPTPTSSGVTLEAGDPLETTLVTAATPTLATTASASTGLPGLSVTDSVQLTGPVAPGTVYTWTLYGPITPGADCTGLDWTGAPVRDSGTIVTTGATTYTTPATTLTAVGCYSYGGSIAASVSSTAVTQAPGVPVETVRIATNLPTVTTIADDGTGLPGAVVSDSIEISGMGAATADYTWNLLGPVAAINDSCATVVWTGAPTVATGSLPGLGNGTHTTPTTTLSDVGCYTYTGSLAASATTDPVTLNPGDLNETFLIDAFEPTVTTVATAATQPGGSTTDAVTVSGSGGVTTTYSWTLVFAQPDGTGDCDAVNWAVDGTVVASGSYSITGDGTTTTPSTTVNDAGCYSYTGEFAATPTSDAVVLAAGIPAETFLLAPFDPDVVTTATFNNGLPGDTIADGVEVTNFGLTPARYDWTLLGPVPAINGSCDTVIWTGAPVLDLGFFTVNPGTSTYQTSDSTLPLPGCYSYTGALAATPSSSAVTLAAGDPAETALIEALVPTASTLISSKQVYVGDTVFDQIFVGNTRGAQPVITWELYGPETPVAGSCDAVDWTASPVLYTGTLTTLGDGTYDTPIVALADAGCYSYSTEIGATPTTEAVTLVAGDPDETVRVVVRPAGLASTGGSIQAGVLIGAGVVLVLGLIAVAFGRRRNRAKHSATS